MTLVLLIIVQCFSDNYILEMQYLSVFLNNIVKLISQRCTRWEGKAIKRTVAKASIFCYTHGK